MELVRYQELAIETDIYDNKQTQFECAILGLNGEAGEVAELVKKSKRDKKEINKEDLIKELGDIMWYLASAANSINVTLEDIAVLNVRKLKDRKNRNVISGSGDNR